MCHQTASADPRFPLLLAFLVLLFGAEGCASIAIATAPAKPAVADNSAQFREADAAFWSTFHGGHYDQIGATLETLSATYLAHPNDPRTALRIAHLHNWRIAERARLPEQHALITEDLMLARRFFQEAVALDGNDPRTQGALAGMLLAEGTIHKDEKLTRQGFFAMNDAVHAWPEYNRFTRGYFMSELPYDNDRFKSALEDQWSTLDECGEGTVDRRAPDLASTLSKETHSGWKRACWNSWSAPHNFEGFLLNMGDMLVKAGDVSTGRKVYAQAKVVKSYSTWPYRDVLERRIDEAPTNVARFRAPAKGEAGHVMMFSSRFCCMGCHQEP